MNIFIDIETLPTESNQQIDYVVSNIKAPANYKKQETIDRYIADAREGEVKKTALSGLFGRVYMIGLAFGDDAPFIIRGDNEAAVIKQLVEMLKRENAWQDNGDVKCTFIGHNAKDFDLPFLSQRMMVHGHGPLWRHVARPPVTDTMQMFSCGRYKQYYSLDALCLAFGIDSPKGELDGSMVHDYYLAGRHDEVAEYCLKDVEATRSVYSCMVGEKVAA